MRQRHLFFAALLLATPACQRSAPTLAPPPAPPVASAAAASSSSTATATAPPHDAPSGEPSAAWAVPTVSASPADRAAAARGEEAFATRLYSRLAAAAHGTDNLFFSPTSVRVALAMAWTGARGDTATEMARVIDVDGDPASVDRGFAAELRRLASAAAADASTHPPTVRIVNRMWGQRGRPFTDRYLQVLSDDFGAPLEALDFARAPEQARLHINAFVDAATEHRIRDLLPAGVVNAQTKLVLTDAVYFKASWLEPFDEHATQQGDFHVSPGKTVRAPLMHASHELRYAKVDGAQVVEIPYAPGTMTMLVAVPDEGSSLSALEHGLTDATVHGWLGALQDAHVTLTLPRVQTTSRFALSEVLGAMGMKTAFAAGRADFSGIDGSKDLELSEVIHQAFVTVDEKGTEAAAATAVALRVAAARPLPEVEVRADRPFLFLIRDTTSGAVLFMGRVEDPTT
jgi:serpin B